MTANKTSQAILIKIYNSLYNEFGPQNWWPGDTAIEIIVGAILTQNTNWTNVEKALFNLKKARNLSVEALKKIPQSKLARLIKPAGYFNVKAKRLKNFMRFLDNEFAGNLNKMGKMSLPDLRKGLLSVNGIGPETADSILLYVFSKPIFVVDAYTKRFLYRHNIVGQDAEYHAIQDIFMQALHHEVMMFNEFHALIVRLGKEYCKPKPSCQQCPLNKLNYSLVYKCDYCHRYLPALRHSKRVPSFLDCDCRQ
ncbi:MAG: endonuclease III domain-containing protein [Candidatus Omnitrophica bacterium]|nr:endonuclease III domain-containing protein [Candidatus Omnitrophota bacterium]MCB9747621.1 endonuclease III domain-containing protein [Candidatus Omnitrophota bacterium]